MPQTSLQELGRAFKEEMPGVFDEISDYELGRAFREEIPEYFGDFGDPEARADAERFVEQTNIAHGAGMGAIEDLGFSFPPEPPTPATPDAPPWAFTSESLPTQKIESQRVRRTREPEVAPMPIAETDAGLRPQRFFDEPEMMPNIGPAGPGPGGIGAPAEAPQQGPTPMEILGTVHESLDALSPRHIVSPEPIMQPGEEMPWEMRVKATAGMGMGGAEPFMDPNLLTSEGERRSRENLRMMLDFLSPESLLTIKGLRLVDDAFRYVGNSARVAELLKNAPTARKVVQMVSEAIVPASVAGVGGKVGADELEAFLEAQEQGDHEAAAQHFDRMVVAFGISGGAGAVAIGRAKGALGRQPEILPPRPPATKPAEPPGPTGPEPTTTTDAILREAQLREILGPEPPTATPPAEPMIPPLEATPRPLASPRVRPLQPRRPPATGEPQPQQQTAQRPQPKPFKEPQSVVEEILAEPPAQQPPRQPGSRTALQEILGGMEPGQMRSEPISRAGRTGTRVFLPVLPPEAHQELNRRLVGRADVDVLDTGETVVDFIDTPWWDEKTGPEYIKQVLDEPIPLSDAEREQIEEEMAEPMAQAEAEYEAQQAARGSEPEFPIEDEAPEVTTAPTTNITSTKVKPEESVTSPETTVGTGTDTNIKTAPERVQRTREVGPVEERPEHVPEGATPGRTGLRVPVASIKVDPQRFQFKIAAARKATGASDKLSDVTRWDPAAEATMLAWRDPDNGEVFIVDGHHRLELANRLGVENIQPQFLDYDAAPTAEAARALAALRNLREGNADPVDAAKFMRDTGFTVEELSKEGVSITQAMIRKANALARLDNSIFGEVALGRIEESYGVAAGEATEDPVAQKKIIEVIQQSEDRTGRKVPNDKAQAIAGRVAMGGQRVTSQDTLFGMEEIGESLYEQEADLISYVRTQLSKEKRLFSTVAQSGQAGRLEEEGNILKADRNKQIAEETKQALAVFDTLVNKAGDINDVIQSKAVEMAEGRRPAADVRKEALESVREAVSKTFSARQGEAEQGREETGRDDQEAPDQGGLDFLLEEGHDDPQDLIDFAEEFFKTVRTGDEKGHESVEKLRSYRAAKPGQTGTVYVNDFGIMVIGTLFKLLDAKSVKEPERLRGVNIKPEHLEFLVGSLKDYSENPKATPEARLHVDHLIANIEEAWNERDSVNIVGVFRGESLMTVRRYVRHECHHQEFAWLKLPEDEAKAFVARPEFRHVNAQLDEAGYGSTPFSRAEEIGARLSEGPTRWNDMQLTSGQAVKALDVYAAARVRSGTLGWQFERAHPFAREAFRAGVQEEQARTAGHRGVSRGVGAEEQTGRAGERLRGEGERRPEAGDRDLVSQLDRIDAAFEIGGLVSKSREELTEFFRQAIEHGLVDLGTEGSVDPKKIAEGVKDYSTAGVKALVHRKNQLFGSDKRGIDLGVMTQWYHTPRYLSELYPNFREIFERAIKGDREKMEKIALLSEMAAPFFRLGTTGIPGSAARRGSEKRLKTLNTRLIEGRYKKTDQIEMDGLNDEQIAAFNAVRQTMDQAFRWMADLVLELGSDGKIRMIAYPLEEMLEQEYAEVREIRADLEQIDKQIERVTGQRNAGDITNDEYKTQKASLAAQKVPLNRRRRELEQPLNDYMTSLLEEKGVNLKPGARAKRALGILEGLRDLFYNRKEGYVPFSRFGKWTYGIKDVAKDKLIEQEHRKTPAQAERRLATLKRFHRKKLESGEFAVIPVKEDTRWFPDVVEGLGLVELNVLMNLAKVDPELKEAIDPILAEKKKQGFGVHFTRSSEVRGFEGDLRRPIADYIMGVSGYIARAKMMRDMKELIREISPITQGRLARYATEYMKYVASPAGEVGWLRNATFHIFLGLGNLTAPVVNLTQIPMMTYPWLIQYAPGDMVSYELTRAYKDVTAAIVKTGGKGFKLFDTDKLPEDVRDAVKNSIDDGVLLSQVVEEMAGIAYVKSQTAQTAWRASGKLFEIAERLNRVVTFIAAHRIYERQRPKAKKVVRRKGESLKHGKFIGEYETPFAFAEDVVSITQLEYGKVNRPKMMRGYAAPLFVFRSFTVGYLEMLQRLQHSWVDANERALKELGPIKPPTMIPALPPAPPDGGGGSLPPPLDPIDPGAEERGYTPRSPGWWRKIGWLRALMMVGIAGGIRGIPGMEDLFDAIDVAWYHTHKGERINARLEFQIWMAEFSNARIADALMSGPPRLFLGPDIAGRLHFKAGIFAPFKPDASVVDLFPAFLVPRQITPAALDFLFNGKDWQDAIAGLPGGSPLKSIPKALKADEEGARTRSGYKRDLGRGREEYTWAEIFWKAMAWYTVTEAQAFDRYTYRQLQRQAAEGTYDHPGPRRMFLEQLVDADLRGDDEKSARIWKDINEWNQTGRLLGLLPPREGTFREVIISEDDIARRKDEMEKSEELRIYEGTRKVLRDFLQDSEGSFPIDVPHPIYDQKPSESNQR